MKRLNYKISILFFCFFIQSTHARVLNLSQEVFGSYFSVETSNSLIKTTPFDGLVSSVDTYSDEFKTNYGGEFGFIYSSPYVGWRFSFEFIKPNILKDIVASTGGVTQYTVTSDVAAVTPKLGVEIHLNKKPNYRLYLFGFYGLSNLTLKNTYSQISVNSLADHTVEAKSSAASTGGGMAFEYSFVDTTTVIFETGYRSLKFTDIKFSKAVNTFQGSKSAGDTLQDVNGTNASINLSSYFFSIGFRFWL